VYNRREPWHSRPAVQSCSLPNAAPQGVPAMRTKFLLGFAVLLLVGLTSGADKSSTELDSELSFDLKALEEAKLGTNGPALLAFLRQRTLPDDERARLAEMVRRLGDDDFDVREEAGKSVIKAGRAAVPFLR